MSIHVTMLIVPICIFSEMAPYYEALCKELKWQVDGNLLSQMKKANEEELKRLDDVLEDAEKNLGESEIRDAMMAKAEYLIRIGDKVFCAGNLHLVRKDCMSSDRMCCYIA